MRKSPKDLVREEVLALTAYQVGDAAGMVSSTRWRTRTRCRRQLQREIAELVSGRRQSLSGPAGTGAEGAPAPDDGDTEACEISAARSDEIIHIMIQALAGRRSGARARTHFLMYAPTRW